MNLIQKIKNLEPKKKLFWWDFIRLPFFYIHYLIPFFGPINPFTSEVAQLPYQAQKDLLIRWTTGQVITYFGSNSGHIWGDFLYLLTGNIELWIIALFLVPLIVFLDYLWVYRSNKLAGKLRVYNWFITIFAYFIWTVFFPLDNRYDYYVFGFVCNYFHFEILIVLLTIYVIFMMWFKFLVSGYFIYLESYESNEKIYPWIPVFLSLGIPGIGQLAKGEVKKGFIFLSLAPLIWIIGLSTFYIPTIIWWLFAAYDAKKIT